MTRDTTWITLHDTTWITLRDTIRQPYSVHDTVFEYTRDTLLLDTLAYATLTVTANYSQRGVAAGSGRFPLGTVVELGAVELPKPMVDRNLKSNIAYSFV